jgi:hypothetical protein
MTNPSGRATSRPGLARTALIVGVLLALLAPVGVVGLGGPFRPVLAAAGRGASGAVVPGTTELGAAEVSLQHGGGPASGTTWSCGSSGAGALSCHPPTAPRIAPHPSVSSPPDWTHQALAPSGRYQPLMAYDPVDKYVVLFGGYNGGVLGDTWTYAGYWTLLHPATSPSARYGAQMAFDSKDGYLVLFGGFAGVHPLGDTWKFVHGSWTRLHPATTPPGLEDASMVWDVNDSALVLFGGDNSSTGLSSATWTFVGGTWALQHPATSPSARDQLQLGYDNTNGWVVLFGGVSSGGAQSDTWNYTHGHWTLRSPTTSPSATHGGAMVNDSSDGYLLLIGGQLGAGAKISGAEWSFVNGSWTKLGPATPPPSRYGAAIAFDSVLGKAVLFGGVGVAAGTKYLNDTWAYRGDVWIHVPTVVPAGNFAGMMTYDEADGYVLYFGGAVIHGNFLLSAYSATWTYAHGHWTQLHPAVSPAPRAGGVMAYDPADGYVVLFGGQSSNDSILGDSWTYLAGKWTELFPTFGPSARILPGFAYDAADGYLVLFGGQVVGGKTVNDTWTFNGGAWTQWIPAGCLTCAPNPAGRYAVSMAYDAADGYVVMFGGENLTTLTATDLGDTWEFSAGVWTNVTASLTVSPPARVLAPMTYDSLDGSLLLQGGENVTSVELGDTWNWSAGAWTLVAPAHSPGPDAYASMAYDPVDKTVVYLAGENDGGTWLY